MLAWAGAAGRHWLSLLAQARDVPHCRVVLQQILAEQAALVLVVQPASQLARQHLISEILQQQAKLIKQLQQIRK